MVAVLAVAFLWCVASAAAADTKPVAYEFVILIDTSRSMHGGGGHGAKDIFPKVKTSVNNYIDSLNLDGSTVYVYTFDDVLTKRPGIGLKSQADKEKVKQVVNGLTSDGQWTAIYNSLDEVLNEMRAVRRADPGTSHVQTILLYTDGRDNRKSMTFEQIASQFQLARGENPNLFLKYVTLGTTADPRWKDIENVEVVPSRPGDVPEPKPVFVQPVKLNFGSLQGRETSEQRVGITFDESLQGAAIDLSALSDDVSGAGGLLSVDPKTIELQGTPDSSGSIVMQQAVTLAVQNRESLDQTAAYSGQIDLTMAGGALAFPTPPSLQFTFTLAPVPQVTVEGADGALDGDLGTLDPYDNGSSVEATREIRAVFNNPAQAAGASLTVRLVRRSGPNGGSAVLMGADGKAANEIGLTPDQPTCSVVVGVSRGQSPGAYVYDLTFEPSAGTALSGIAIDAKSGTGVFPVRFSVPAAPAPLWKTIVKWAVVALVVLVVLLVIGFFALCLITGSGPVIMAGLLIRRLSPKLQDARVEVTAPAKSAQQFELSGKKFFEVGHEQIETMPFAVRFESHVSVLSAKDEAVVRAHPKDDQSFFTILRATTGIEETANDSAVATGDVITFDGTDGERCELVFRSFNYVNA